MSSSVFAKSPESTNESRIDSNLVVVFGKNGINVDRKGLENLVDDKSLSTISVIRLTSPTPSMEDQVQEKDEVQNRKIKNSDEDDSEIDEHIENEEEDENYEDEDNSDLDNDDGEEDELLATLKGKKFKKREKPEIVGLTVENFYLPDEAKQIAKQILNVSGVNPLFINIDYKMQMLAIENDHCYTPLLSPSQLNRNKLNETIKTTVPIPSTSKVSQQKNINTNPRKINSGSSTDTENSGKRDSIDEKSYRMENKNETEDDFEDDDSEYEIESLDTDNDRDSDLDFNVYDRSGRKQRKLSTKKSSKRLSIITKIPKKRQLSHADNNQEIEDKKLPQQSARASRLSSESKSSVKSPILSVQQNQPIIESDIISLQPNTTKHFTTGFSKVKTILSNLPTSSKQTIAINMDKTSDRQLLTGVVKNQLVKLSTGDQSGKAIVQNVVIIKPPHKTMEGQSSGGFTDISKYLTKLESNKSNVKVSELIKSDNTSSPIIVTRTVPKLSIGNIQQQQMKTIRRGFMPLEIGSVNKNELPSQISIQTHQSSSELLAAENDKQLDLIDSIVKDEMKKSNIIDKDSIKKNVSIPKLVKMLESTEDTMYVQQPQQQLSSISTLQTSTIAPNTPVSTFRNTVEDIDIANAPLLDTPTDEIPEDLLKDVAELIDNKTLQEFVEKQSLIDQQEQQSLTDFTSNVPSTLATSQQLEYNSQSTAEIKTTASLNISQGVSTPVRNEPIQIMQRNGKIITLPPIEAPTTRAKRRAAANTSISVNKLENNEAAVILPQSTQKQNTVSSWTSSVGNDKSETSSRRGSKEQTKIELIKKKRVSTSVTQNNPKDESGGDSSQEEDDDDPNKLWCICRQPHNNRFMICCDICEDWFHGACVNVTKAMGLDMEQKGIEWTCPKCLKIKKPVQRKITEIFDKKTTKAAQQKNAFDSAQLTKKMTHQGHKLQMSDAKKQHLIKRQSSDSSSGTGSGSNTPKLMQKQLFDLSISKQNKTETPKKNVTHSNVSNSNPISISTDQENLKQDAATSPVSITPKHTQTTTENIDETLNCIVCKKLARINSIYCSDDCIRKHASNALVIKVSKGSNIPIGSPTAAGDVDKKKKTPSSFEEALAIASHLQPKKLERVSVYERKSGRILIGNNAPTTGNLKKWLQDNPTFEVVQPGSPQAILVEKKQKSRSETISVSEIASTVTSPTPSSVQTQQVPSQQPTLIKVIKQPTPTTAKLNKIESSSNIKDRSNSPKQLHKYPPQVKIRSDKYETPKHVKKSLSTLEKDQNIAKDSKETAKKTTPQSEPIRLNVKRTLKEQLTSRMNELKETDAHAILLTPIEIEKFANKTEEEMFKLFNKDTGSKYKAKYRSLSFNLKDRKNKTLFKKICEKLIEPHQLVRMSPEELASQELAQWRQNENKHQLEMIKKSELDLLSCAKNYVLKTHKGEEVIESKSTDRLNLDISIPVEDVVTVLNNSTVSSTSELEKTSPCKDQYKTATSFDNTYDNDNSYTTTSTSGLNAFMKSSSENNTTATITSGSTTKSSSSDKKKSSSKDRDREHREKRHKNKDHHKDKSRKRSRSRSRSRERTKHNKSPYKDDKKEHEKRKDSRYHDTSSKNTKTITMNTKQLSSNTKTSDKGQKPKDQITETKLENAPQTYSLIDKILESTKTIEEAANLKPDTEKKIPPTSTYISVASPLELKTSFPILEQKKIDTDSDQEPSSTVVIATPPQEEDFYTTSDLDTVLWTGSINMIDVATFEISIQPASGIYTDLEKDLPNELDVVGRISPETVWDYISKLKKSPNKEVVIIRLVPSSETENIAYSALYMYLDKRERLGVVKTFSRAIKDFYILPLGNRKPLPSVLQPVTNPLFFEDELRPDLLLGIVIRIMPGGGFVGVKRPHTNIDIAGMPVQKRHTDTSVILKKSIPTISLEDDEEHYTPPGTPPAISARSNKTKLSLLSDARNKAEPKYDDADEPYSPGGSSGDDDLLELSTSKAIKLTVPPQSNIDQDELKRKMDEINRQIEAQQQEIAGMLGTDAYSPTDTTLTTPTLAPALANISIPSNLQQILASIQSKPVTESQKSHSIIGSHGNNEFNNRDESYKPIVQSSNSSRLAQLSEAELLSMVPDGIEINKKQTDNIKSFTSQTIPSPTKKARWDVEPPPPGLEDEFE